MKTPLRCHHKSFPKSRGPSPSH